jgi:hypothetical protein
MANPKPNLTQLLAHLGYRPLSRTWAKMEILLGLASAAIGFGLGIWQLTRPTAQIDGILTAAGLVLFVLGGYLTLAGNRSHLYQSNNELAAYLIAEIRRLQEKVESR